MAMTSSAHEPTQRVLVMSHSHPAVTHGGAEISAFALFEGLRGAGVSACFLGCSHRPAHARLGTALAQPFGADEYLYAPGTFDHFTFANRDPRFAFHLAELLQRLQPTIVHAHHYTTLGSEIFAIIRRIRPQAKLVLSLHEYLAICNNYGQMVTAGDFRLCDEENPSRCADCFPARTPGDFLLRKRYLLSLFDEVDCFVSPSRFLAERYAAWGLDAEKIRVLGNVPADCADPAPTRVRTPGLRVGFFGQISPLKGISVLIDAARRLEALGARTIVIDIFGDYSNQPAEFQATMRTVLAAAGPNVAYHGPYRNAEVGRLMRSVDAVVVPSIWWENAPVVIQEALRCRTPVICSDIGGMAETVRPELDGLHFRVGDADSLCQAIIRLGEPGLLERLRETIAVPIGHAEAVARHLQLYRELQTL